jgi:hypothetical protein
MFHGPSARISIRNLGKGRVASYIVFALLLGLALSAQTSAKDTGYVFVSNEKMHSVAVARLSDHQMDRNIPRSPGGGGPTSPNGRSRVVTSFRNHQ